jgi:hypothetical protein
VRLFYCALHYLLDTSRDLLVKVLPNTEHITKRIGATMTARTVEALVESWPSIADRDNPELANILVASLDLESHITLGEIAATMRKLNENPDLAASLHVETSGPTPIVTLEYRKRPPEFFIPHYLRRQSATTTQEH